MKFFKPDESDVQQQNNPYAARKRFLHEETLTEATGASDWLVIPPGIGDLLVTLKPAVGATARVEYTQSPYSDVVADTATPRSWDSGDVTEETASAMLNAMTAIRFVTAGADCDLIVTA